MKNKKIVISLVFLMCAGLIAVFFCKDFFTMQTGGHYRNITDLASSYNADKEIAQALEQMKNSQEKATVITRSTSGLRHIALTFDGLTDRTIVQQILDLLKKYNAKATFFVDGVQTAEDPQAIVNIKKAGQRIENYTLLGMAKMETLPVERLVNDFSRAQKIIKVTTDQEPNLLKCNDTKYTDQLLQVAKACGFKSVVKSDIFFNAKSDTADAFIRKVHSGSIISVKLKPNVEPIVDEQGKTDLRPAIDKQPGLKDLSKVYRGETEIVIAIEKLLIALNKANYTTSYVEDFANSPTKATTSSNLAKMAYLALEQVTAFVTFPTAYAADFADQPAQELKMITTTEPALSYTFGGLSNPSAVNDVLGRLQDLGIKATFFVLEVEMQRYPQTLRKIIANGHEIGIALRPKDGETIDETSQAIMRSRKVLQEQFGIATKLVKQPWGVVTDTTKAAVSLMGCNLIGQSVNVVQSKHKDYHSADQVMSEIFGKSVLSLARGQIIHFRMDYYTNDRLIGDLVEAIKQRKIDNIAYVTSYDNPANNPANDSQYMIKPVGKIMNNPKFTYQYPVALSNVPTHLRADRALAIGEHKLMEEASKRYIGHQDVTYEDRMLGFSKMETRRLDTSGLIHTRNNVIFLTFDDWGTDAAINKILYVLRKHNASATFFIITNNVLNNPNLLRTIAIEGHEIGSHSDQHKPMAVRDPKTGRQVKTQDKEEYRQDLTTAFRKLRSITGDVTVNDRPSLTRFFRPSTLAVSKIGFEALFETGYEYIINGSCSTYDYKAENVSQLVRTIRDGIYTKNGEVKRGAVLVMHMGDASVYTAMALDILLTANAAKADSDPSKFRSGRLSDYLIDGYSQINRQKTLQLKQPT